MEKHISDIKIEEVSNRIEYHGQYQVEAQGFQVDVWMLWDTNEVNLTLVNGLHEFVAMEVKKRSLQSTQALPNRIKKRYGRC